MALKEFDFLDDDTVGGAEPSTVATAPPNANSSNLMRPVITMPRVLIMGGGPTPSPIVEMPPSPAPNQMPVVEYPEDVDEHANDEYVDDANFDIEVGTRHPNNSLLDEVEFGVKK